MPMGFDAKGNLVMLPDTTPVAVETIENVSIATETIDTETVETTTVETVETVDTQPQTEDTHVETPKTVFRILESYGYMSSEELFMTHYNREKSRCSEVSDDDLMQCLKELDLIVQIGKIRQRAADDVRLERLESKKRSDKEKQKLKDTNYQPKSKEKLSAIEQIQKEADAKAKKKKSDVQKIMDVLGVSEAEAEAILKNKAQ